MNFSDRPKNMEEILRLIARTSVGRKSLDQFLPRYHSSQVTIEHYPLDIVERLRAVLGEGQPIGACFVNDGKKGTIYLDPGGALGILAPFLFHEIVHSLDASLWKDSGETGEKTYLLAETKAFDLQHRFVQELSERYPDYRQFLVSQYPRVRILHDRLTTEDVADLYGFKAS